MAEEGPIIENPPQRQIGLKDLKIPSALSSNNYEVRYSKVTALVSAHVQLAAGTVTTFQYPKVIHLVGTSEDGKSPFNATIWMPESGGLSILASSQFAGTTAGEDYQYITKSGVGVKIHTVTVGSMCFSVAPYKLIIALSVTL